MSELVKELRGRKVFSLTAASHFLDELCKAAANRIESLEAQLAGRTAVPVDAAQIVREEWQREVRESSLRPGSPAEALAARILNRLSEAQEGEGETRYCRMMGRYCACDRRCEDLGVPEFASAPAEKAAEGEVTGTMLHAMHDAFLEYSKTRQQSAFGLYKAQYLAARHAALSAAPPSTGEEG